MSRCALPGVELRRQLQPRPALTHVVFDFDGTISWLRHGWPEMMCAVFLEHFPERPRDTPESRRALLLDEILALNGRPSIYQCRRFVELVRERAGPELDAEHLRAEFQRRLDEAIARRIAKIRTGAAPPSAYLVHGAREFLGHVARASLTPAILSTTIQERLSEEAELLGIAHHFGPHLYGGTGNPLQFSKRAVFERLLREEGVLGERLLAFGDGPIETRDTKELGGIAIAVCSDETRNGSGVLDPRKLQQLFAAGADAAISDFRAAAALLDFLLGR